MKDYEIYKKHILKNGVHPIELSKVRDFDLDDHDAVSYTHLTLPTNREV